MKKIVIILIAIVIVAGAGFTAKVILDQKNKQEIEETKTSQTVDLGKEVIQKEEIKIFKGSDRPIAVVLENSTKDDWPHLGLKDSYLVYEIIVEGGYTKLMPLYKGVSVDEIGYVRSARPYFIDYALENDAVLAHYGHTIMTADDEAKLKIDYIDGLNLSSSDKTFTTVKGYTTGNAKRIVASIESLRAKMEEKKIRMTSTDKGFNYVAKDYDLDTEDNIATSIRINYSTTHYTSYEYDLHEKVYKRSMRGTPHIDQLSKEQLTAKNIIALFVKSSPLNDKREVPDKGYQKLETVGTGTGYFFTNGKYIEITWSKASRTAKTKYLDLEGNEIKLNDGVTYIQIIPAPATQQKQNVEII